MEAFEDNFDVWIEEVQRVHAMSESGMEESLQKSQAVIRLNAKREAILKNAHKLLGTLKCRVAMALFALGCFSSALACVVLFRVGSSATASCATLVVVFFCAAALEVWGWHDLTYKIRLLSA